MCSSDLVESYAYILPQIREDCLRVASLSGTCSSVIVLSACFLSLNTWAPGVEVEARWLNRSSFCTIIWCFFGWLGFVLVSVDLVPRGWVVGPPHPHLCRSAKDLCRFQTRLVFRTTRTYRISKRSGSRGSVHDKTVFSQV